MQPLDFPREAGGSSRSCDRHGERGNSPVRSKRSKIEEYQDRVNLERLTSLCEEIRASIQRARSVMDSPRLGDLSALLNALVEDEDDPMRRIHFEDLKAARLDKLLEDVLDPDHHLPQHPPLAFRETVAKARYVQQKWRSRFRHDYFSIDVARCEELEETGQLRGMLLDVGTTTAAVAAEDAADEPGWVVVDGRKRSADFGLDLLLQPGAWFINVQSAFRDGVVGTYRENLSRSRYGTKTLPLLTGREETTTTTTDNKNSNTNTKGPTYTTYTRQGSSSEMHYSLLSEVGQTLRILRGHRLRSPLAPAAGLRYDGAYTVRGFGLRLDREAGDVYTMTAHLERLVGQPGPSLAELAATVPRPSQLDDWRLAKALEEREMMRRAGPARFLEWKAREEDERVEKEHWRIVQEFKKSMVGPVRPGLRSRSGTEVII